MSQTCLDSNEHKSCLFRPKDVGPLSIVYVVGERPQCLTYKILEYSVYSFLRNSTAKFVAMENIIDFFI